MSDILAQLIDADHGVAFAEFSRLYLALDPADQAHYEIQMKGVFGPEWLAHWQDWRHQNFGFQDAGSRKFPTNSACKDPNFSATVGATVGASVCVSLFFHSSSAGAS